MGRYLGPKTKISRRFGEPIYGPDKALDRRNFPPGVHGAKRRRKISDYGTQLREKQKAKRPRARRNPAPAASPLASPSSKPPSITRSSPSRMPAAE